MFRQSAVSLLLAAGFAVGATSTTTAQTMLRASSVSGGAGTISENGFVLTSSITPIAHEPITESGQTLEGGFLAQVARNVGPVAVPTAVADTASTDEDTAVGIAVLANDSDPAETELTIVGFSQAAHGSVALTDSMTLSYTPNLNFFGDDSLSYSVANAFGGVSMARVDVTVRPIDDLPAFITQPVFAAILGEEYRYVAIAIDVDGDPVSIEASVLPAWLEAVEPTDSSITLLGTPVDETHVGPNPVSLTVSDGQSSVARQFAIIVAGAAPAAAPDLLTPENESTVEASADVQFTWDDVDDATSYTIQLAASLDFSTPLDTMRTAATRWAAEGLTTQTDYFWRVRANNSLGSSEYGNPFKFTTGMAVAVEGPTGLPESFSLHQNYPNPFNPSTTISYELPESTPVTLIVYDMYGRAIKSLVDDRQSAGKYDVVFDAQDLATGSYFYRIQAGTFSQTRQLFLIK